MTARTEHYAMGRGSRSRVLTERRCAAIKRWIRMHMHKSQRAGYCAQATGLYLSDLLFDLSITVTRDVWIDKSFSIAEVEIWHQGKHTTLTISL